MADPMDMIIVRYNGIRTVSLTCDCTWQSAWSATPVHLTTLMAQAEGHVREAHPEAISDIGPEPEKVHSCPPPGSGLMPCCGRSPFEMPRTDRLARHGEPTTCPGRPVVIHKVTSVTVPNSSGVRDA